MYRISRNLQVAPQQFTFVIFLTPEICFPSLCFSLAFVFHIVKTQKIEVTLSEWHCFEKHEENAKFLHLPSLMYASLSPSPPAPSGLSASQHPLPPVTFSFLSCFLHTEATFDCSDASCHHPSNQRSSELHLSQCWVPLLRDR